MTHAQTDLPWNRRLRAWIRRNWLLDTAWRITVFIVGVTLVSLGLMFLLLPGPGWALIAIGLIVLASEFLWARKLLQPVREKLGQARRKAAQPQYRNAVRVTSTAAVLVMGAVVGAYVWRYGLTLDGVRGLWPL